METLDRVYVASHVAHRYDDGLYHECYVYVDAEIAWRRFMDYYYDMVGEGEEPKVDLDELREKLVERGESVSITYTDNCMEDHIISVCVEKLIHTRVKREESEEGENVNKN